MISFLKYSFFNYLGSDERMVGFREVPLLEAIFSFKVSFEIQEDIK